MEGLEDVFFPPSGDFQVRFSLGFRDELFVKTGRSHKLGLLLVWWDNPRTTVGIKPPGILQRAFGLSFHVLRWKRHRWHPEYSCPELRFLENRSCCRSCLRRSPPPPPHVCNILRWLLLNPKSIVWFACLDHNPFLAVQPTTAAPVRNLATMPIRIDRWPWKSFKVTSQQNLKFQLSGVIVVWFFVTR